MTNPCVLVTGGSGFIGTWVLRELLSQDIPTVVVDPHPAPERWQRVLGEGARAVRRADVSLLDRDGLQAVLERHGVTHVIHLAALLTPACQEDPWRGCQTNVLGSTTVFDAARRSGRVGSVAYASSFAVYGPGTGDTAAEADHPTMFYGAFKLAVDLIAEQYWRHSGIASVAVRPHVVYGPERDQGLTAGPSLAARAAALGEPYTIGYTGRVGYDYIEDAAQAFVRCAFETPPGAHVADLPGEQATSEEFVQAIAAVLPEAADLIRVEGPEIPTNIPPEPRYLSRLFPDWQPTSLQEGVRRTLEFYRGDAQPR